MYKKIPGYENYSINANGEIYSHNYNKILAAFTNNRGYICVKLYKSGKQNNLLVHRLLAFVFLDLPSLESDLEVDHIDTNISNNSLSNLQVLTKLSHRFKTHGEYSESLEKYCFCGKKLSEFNTSGLCREHWDFSRTNDDITLEKIVTEVLKSNWVKAGEKLGLSDNGLRKRYKKLSGGLNPKDIKFNHSS